MNRDHAAALAPLDKIADYSWSINEYGRALAALPELAGLTRVAVPLLDALIEDFGLPDDDDTSVDIAGEMALTFKHIRDLKAALAAVADKLTQGKGK